MQHDMCMFLYSKPYFSNTTIILFLKRHYPVCTTLILMDSNIIKIQPYNTRICHHQYTKKCVFKQKKEISTPPSTRKI
jgi:hypothetical protein